ncbi:hypothetical protein EYF80_024156 [Liparis tanakae]|uniref:Uncharacterized protein n=1 Tax=Liparis tanakae TaxID=230148 RepID=A0A4Z2HIM6_9TELE|nr:hypothetical protein EYF80_024156 [Liparis tanakae]
MRGSEGGEEGERGGGGLWRATISHLHPRENSPLLNVNNYPSEDDTVWMKLLLRHTRTPAHEEEKEEKEEETHACAKSG